MLFNNIEDIRMLLQNLYSSKKKILYESNFLKKFIIFIETTKFLF